MLANEGCGVLANEGYCVYSLTCGVYDPTVTYTDIETCYDELVVPYTVALVSGPNTTNVVVQDGCAAD